MTRSRASLTGKATGTMDSFSSRQFPSPIKRGIVDDLSMRSTALQALMTPTYSSGEGMCWVKRYSLLSLTHVLKSLG